MIYEGPPSRSLPMLVAAIRRNLEEGRRCMYLNSPPMVAGVRSHLYAAGIDPQVEVARGALVLGSEPDHLVHGRFDVDRLIALLDAAVEQALADGHTGLFATGDMTWEFGPERDFTTLVEYEWRLEQLFQRRPQLRGVCQYHRDLLPREAVREGAVSHGALFISDTLARLNPLYLRDRTPAERKAAALPHLDDALAALLAHEP